MLRRATEQRGQTRDARLAACALVLAVSLIPATFAHAEPSPEDSSAETSTVIKEKKAEKKAALAELERMRVDMAAQVDRYISTGRRIAATRAEIAEVTAEIEKQSGSLVSAQEALTRRAVELYRTDQTALVELLFTARSIPQLMNRMGYLAAASRHDSQLIDEVRLERQESLWLRETLSQRMSLLTELQQAADEQRELIEKDMKSQEKRAESLGEDIARLMREEAARAAAAASTGGEPKEGFNPDTLINEARFRDADSMSVADIQSFLNDQPGTLKYYRARDYRGVSKSAAQMIAEAATAWRINPQVILVTLQKEQSILSDPNPTQRDYDWAMGCGKMDSGTLSKYQGFGNQIWYGAKSLDANANRWSSGAELSIDGSLVIPSSSATFALYKYTPHLHGNMSFWMLHWRYFGDPLSVPAS